MTIILYLGLATIITGNGLFKPNISSSARRTISHAMIHAATLASRSFISASIWRFTGRIKFGIYQGTFWLACQLPIGQYWALDWLVDLPLRIETFHRAGKAQQKIAAI